MPLLRRLVPLLLVAVACGAAPVHAQTLSLAYHRGDSFQYSYHSTSKQTIIAGGVTLPTEIEVTAAEAVTVKSVDSSGNADLTLVLSNVKITSRGTSDVANMTSGIEDLTTSLTVAADGHIVSQDGQQVAAGNAFLTAAGAGGTFFVTAVLPSSAVKPGDTWSKDYTQTSLTNGAIKITTHSKYLRNESLKGVNAAVVETTSNGSIDFSTGGGGGLSIKGTMTANVTAWIDLANRRVLKSHSAQSNDGTMDVGSSAGLGGITGPLTIKGTGTTDLTPV